MTEQKHIVVTGASKGLGRAMVEGFIAEGHQVSACARNEKTMQELSKQYGSEHRFDVVDLASTNDIESWCTTILKVGTPDIIVNNAALMLPNGPLWEVPVEDFESLVQVNITGVFCVTKHLLPAMLDAGSGVIINFSSGWGRSVSPEVASYCTSKFAIEGMTQALSMELPQGFAAIPLNPGIINTDMLQSCYGEAANNHDDATQWATRAVPYILEIGPRDNGKSLSIPG